MGFGGMNAGVTFVGVFAFGLVVRFAGVGAAFAAFAGTVRFAGSALTGLA